MASPPRDAQEIRLTELAADSPPPLIRQAQDLLLEYGKFVIAQPGAGRFCFGSLEKEAHDLPSSYLAQGGGCLVAHVGGHPAGFVAWRAIAASSEVVPDACEMKRLWVRPIARGFNLGRLLTLAVLDRVRRAGRKAIYLDTAPASMSAAHRLYLELGFEPCSPYNDNPVEGLAYLVKFL